MYRVIKINANITMNASYDLLAMSRPLAASEEHLNPSREERLPSDASSRWPWMEGGFDHPRTVFYIKKMVILPSKSWI